MALRLAIVCAEFDSLTARPLPGLSSSRLGSDLDDSGLDGRQVGEVKLRRAKQTARRE